MAFVFTKIWNKTSFFKYFLYNLMASFFFISLSSTQPKREFTNQHHMKYRSARLCSSFCLSKSQCELLWDSLDQTHFILNDKRRVQNNFGIHLSFVIFCQERHPTGLQRAMFAEPSNHFQYHEILLFCQAKSKSLSCNANPNMGVWDGKKKGKRGPFFWISPFSCCY